MNKWENKKCVNRFQNVKCICDIKISFSRSINFTVTLGFCLNACIICDVTISFPPPLSLEQTGTKLTSALAYTQSASCSKVRNIHFPGKQRANLDAVMGWHRTEAAFNWTTSRRRQDIRDSKIPGRRTVDPSGSCID